MTVSMQSLTFSYMRPDLERRVDRIVAQIVPRKYESIRGTEKGIDDLACIF